MGLDWCVLGVASTCKSMDVGGLLWGQMSGGAWKSSPEEGMEPGGCRLPAEAGRHRASTGTARQHRSPSTAVLTGTARAWLDSIPGKVF